MKKFIITAAAALLCVIPQEAEAAGSASKLMPTSTRPMWFALGVGPSSTNVSGRGFGRGRNFFDSSRGKMVWDFGYHLSGDSSGPAIGATIEQSNGHGLYVFNPGFKFWWDIQITDFAIYLSPQAKIGPAFASHGSDEFLFAIGHGIEGKVIFKDRWVAFWRPLYFDTLIGDFGSDSMIINIEGLIGGGVTF